MKSRQKSRSGCKKCKEKKLKCDEAKPACLNCTRKGLTCPGYQQRLQWSTKHEYGAAAKRIVEPTNFTQLVSAASQSIRQQKGATSRRGPSMDTITFSILPANTSAASSPEGSANISQPALPPTHDSNDSANDLRRRRASSPALTQSLVDIPTFLIDHWFKSVCPFWSAYDSDSNPFRRLTSSAWATSPSVYWALQAISAASLVERLPHVLKETAKCAPRMAHDAIAQDLVVMFTSSAAGPVDKLPSELLLSLFCMSSSLCWMEARELGLQYVRQARAVLTRLHVKAMSASDQELFDFFNGCLIYEEMLRSVVSDDEVDSLNMLSWPEPDGSSSPLILDLHAWTGVSSHMLRLFGKAMAICRRSRNRWRQREASTYRFLQGAMRDIEAARRVEESLLAAEAPAAWNDRMAADEGIDLQCLRDMTEAYRLTSLLQLYLTFPDLVANRIPSQVDKDGLVSWDGWVLPLTLHIIETLERIPPNTMKCIQPLLCVCAGSGLRLDSKPPQKQAKPSEVPGGDEAPPLLEEMASSEVPQAWQETWHARQFLLHRLEQLQLSLPPKPIEVAKQLLRTVWDVYDNEEPGSARRSHWIDVMTRTGLQSLFG